MARSSQSTEVAPISSYVPRSAPFVVIAKSVGLLPESLCDQTTPGLVWLTANPEASTSVALSIRRERLTATKLGQLGKPSGGNTLLVAGLGELRRLAGFGTLNPSTATKKPRSPTVAAKRRLER